MSQHKLRAGAKPKRQSAHRKSQSKQDTLVVVIETPKGFRNKIKYDASNKAFTLSKVMPEGMVFPYDFGFVPSTRAEDGDPIDVLVLADDALFPGCRVECHLVGVIEAQQEEEGESNRNDRLIAVAEASILYSRVKSIEEIPSALLEQVKSFFVNYQRIRNVKVTILGTGGPAKAERLLSKARFKRRTRTK
jgi:inorganic pyrophosphatase